MRFGEEIAARLLGPIDDDQPAITIVGAEVAGDVTTVDFDIGGGRNNGAYRAVTAGLDEGGLHTNDTDYVAWCVMVVKVHLREVACTEDLPLDWRPWTITRR